MNFKTITAVFTALFCAAGFAWGIWAESVYSQTLAAGAAPTLTPVRRTTIVTAEPEASLRFYRDVLGFEVEYDRIVVSSGTLGLLAPGASEGRIIALRYGEKLGGSIGLFWTEGLPPVGPCVIPAVTGSASILLLTDDLAAMRARFDAAGVPSSAPPVAYSESRGPTNVYSVFDPNCVRIAIAQIANETLEESLNK